MGANTLKDVFQHSLGDIYDAEQQIMNVLDQMETETQDSTVRKRMREHRDETQRQIQNLEQCFELLGTHAPKVQCLAIRGLREEKRNFDSELPSEAAREIYNLDATEKTEHYEIASYRSLIDQARVLGQTDLTRLLEQNLEQEERMRTWVEDQQPRVLEKMQNMRGRPS